MPSKSPAQRRLMQAVAHDPSFAKKVGVPQAVGQEFAAADASMTKTRAAHVKAAKAHSATHRAKAGY